MHPTKQLGELVSVITEMHAKMSRTEDIAGERMGEMHMRSVPTVLDPMTGQHGHEAWTPLGNNQNGHHGVLSGVSSTVRALRASYLSRQLARRS